VASADSALFARSAMTVSATLAGSLGLVVFAERRHLRELKRRVMFVRWRTWLITAPIYGVAVMGGTWTSVLLVEALVAVAIVEYARMTRLTAPYRNALLIAGLASAPIAALSLTIWRGMPPVLLLAETLPPLLSQDVRNGLKQLAYAALGFAYVPWLLTYFVLVRNHITGGAGILIALGVAVAVSDVAAFAAGNLFGRHPLAATLSPNKTWEGVAGNLAGAALGLAIMGFALPAGLSIGVRLALPLVVAAGAVWGDLLESLLKRTFGVKDAGTWLPGFGGLLDRIDSMLVVLPLTYTLFVVTA
jgi:phosphatidate cytidylyltransferase